MLKLGIIFPKISQPPQTENHLKSSWQIMCRTNCFLRSLMKP